jgi:hypothetical protein
VHDADFVRSAIAPEAIVTAVAANTAWKKNVVATLSPPSAGIVRSAPDRKNMSLPMKSPPPGPKAKAKPTAKKAMMPMSASERFLAKMLTTFFERVNPASTSANPACMKNTRQPAMNTHMLSSTACTAAESGPSVCAPATDGKA